MLSNPQRASGAADRALWLCAAATIAAVAMTARVIAPDARGVGTHTQLGLPPCPLLALTGLPCPACGLTTCFAHLVRGEFAAAWQCHAFGVVLFGAALAAFPYCVWAAVRKRAFFETLARMHVAWICGVFACAALAQWAARVARLLLG